MEDTKITNRTLDILRKNFERKDKAGTKYYFTVNVKLDEGDDEIQLVENATGLEEFDAAIQDALENDPSEIIIIQTTRKNEPRRKSNTTTIELQPAKPADVPTTSEMIEKIIAEKTAEIKAGLSGMANEDGALGMIQEKFSHETKLLQLDMEKKTTQMQHQKEVEDLRRKLDDKDAEIVEQRAEIQEANNDLDKVLDAFEEFKKNKFAGLSDQLSEVGTKALAGLAAKVLPMLSGGNGGGIAGLPDAKNTTEIDEEPTAADKLLDEIRDMMKSFTSEQFTLFYNLMVLIANDKNTLDIVMKFLKPDGEGGASQ